MDITDTIFVGVLAMMIIFSIDKSSDEINGNIEKQTILLEQVLLNENRK